MRALLAGKRLQGKSGADDGVRRIVSPNPPASRNRSAYAVVIHYSRTVLLPPTARYWYCAIMELLFVVGAGRSGTSAITRVLSLCGATLPDRVLRPGSGNPSGYWEAVVAIKRNDQFLSAANSSYHDPSLVLGPVPPVARDRHFKNIRSFLRALPPADLVVIKDPRISGLVDAWDEAARALGFVPKYVHIFRNPADVAASLNYRYGFPLEHSLALWLKYNLLPERATRGSIRMFASYEEMLADWRCIVRRCNEDLSLKLELNAEVDRFLSPELHHNRTGRLDDPTPAGWVQRTHAALLIAERSRKIDTDEMNRIFDEYHAFDRFIGGAHRSYRIHVANQASRARAIGSNADD